MCVFCCSHLSCFSLLTIYCLLAQKKFFKNVEASCQSAQKEKDPNKAINKLVKGSEKVCAVSVCSILSAVYDKFASDLHRRSE